ncbi:glutathione binding-like protein [Neorhizobium lilium]|uniref:glutathione binding-like protein n=1 Tax=Neorhizobium lilium TaxID=2503024 RepID=UPI00247986ED|nr:glutathione binding-like protein [Neorhizobium lilium]
MCCSLYERCRSRIPRPGRNGTPEWTDETHEPGKFGFLTTARSSALSVPGGYGFGIGNLSSKRFDLIEETLKKTSYLMGSSFTVADAYLFTVLGWMPGFAIDLGPCPSISDYIQRIEGRASVAAARVREAEIPTVT